MNGGAYEQTAETGADRPVISGRWVARHWLLAPALGFLLPALIVYGTAILRSLGVPRPYALAEMFLPAPDASLGLRQAVGWSLTLLCPAMAALLSALASVNVEVRAGTGGLSGRLWLAGSTPRPMHFLAAFVLLAGLVLFALMSGHLAADAYACAGGITTAC